MKRYTVCTESNQNYDYELNIDQKILVVESFDVIVSIIKDWLNKLGLDINITTNFDDGNFRINAADTTEYRFKIIDDDLGLRIRIIHYNNKYVIEEIKSK